MVDRIQKLIHQKKLSSSGFADMIGVPRSTISHIVSGRNNPSLEFIQKVLDAFPDISTDWLVRGKGTMYIAESHRNSPPLSNNVTRDIATQASLFDAKDTSKVIGVSSQPQSKSSVIIAQDLHESSAPASKTDVGEKMAIRDLDKNKLDIGQTPKISNENDIKTGKNCKQIARIVFIYSDSTFSDHIPE